MITVDITKFLSIVDIINLINTGKWTNNSFTSTVNCETLAFKKTRYEGKSAQSSEILQYKTLSSSERHGGKVIVKTIAPTILRHFDSGTFIDIEGHYVLSQLVEIGGQTDRDWTLNVEFIMRQRFNKTQKNSPIPAYITTVLDMIAAPAAPTVYDEVRVYYLSQNNSPATQTPDDNIILPRIEQAQKMKRVLDIFTAFSGGPQARTLKSAFNQPKHLSRAYYLYALNSNIEGYYYTPKLDGEKCIFVNLNRKSWLLFETRVEEFKSTIDEAYIADCELMTPNKLYIVDVIAVNNEHLAAFPFAERLARFADFTARIPEIPEKYKFDATKEFKPVIFQNDIAQRKKILADMHALAKKYPENDGFILYSPNGSYLTTSILKVKPAEKNTIDFYIKECSADLRDKYVSVAGSAERKKKEASPVYPVRVFFLFSSIRKELMARLGIRKFDDYSRVINERRSSTFTSDIIPIQFSPATHPRAYIWITTAHPETEILDEQVGEFSFNGANFILDRMRPDKIDTYGNAFLTAETQWLDMANPLTLEFICGLSASASDDNNDPSGDEPPADEESSYFQAIRPEENIYQQFQKENRRFKGELYHEHMRGAPKIIDFAGGRGADMKNWQMAQIRSVMVVEQDEDAVAELIRRRNEILTTKRHEEMPRLYALVYNLNLPAAPILASIEKYNLLPFDGASCNFAIHYLVPNITDFASLVSQCLRPRARFFFTCFDGQKVFDLLAANNGVYEVYEGERLKYKLVSKYNEKKFTRFLKIDVLLPFSRGRMYEEFLVDIEEFKKQFANADMTFIKRHDFKSERVPDIDKEYAALMTGIVFEKK